MATPALRARLSTPAEVVQVLFTDEPMPHAPDRLLKTVPVASVTVSDDAEWAAGGARLVEVTLADAEIQPRRRFDIRTVRGGVVSAAGPVGVVPPQLTDSAGKPLFDTDGSPLIPAPAFRVRGQLLDADGEPLYDSNGSPLLPTP